MLNRCRLIALGGGSYEIMWLPPKNMAGVGNSNCAWENLRYRYRCTLHTHDKRGDDTNTQDTQELTTAKQTPGTTEQVLEKESHELHGLGTVWV